jgi:hypothetical protein
VTVNAPDGWFPYMEDFGAAPPILERTAHLATWNTGSLNGDYDLRLAYTLDYPLNPGSAIHYSATVTIVVDNDDFTVSPTATMRPAPVFSEDEPAAAAPEDPAPASGWMHGTLRPWPGYTSSDASHKNSAEERRAPGAGHGKDVPRKRKARSPCEGPGLFSKGQGRAAAARGTKP